MKRWLILLGTLAIAGAGIGFYMYNKPKTAMDKMKTDNAMEASALVNEFELDESAAEMNYLDKTIEVQGVVKDKNESGIILESGNDMVGVLCEFENTGDLASINIKDNVKVKGVCTGKLLDVVLSRCIIVQ